MRIYFVAFLWAVASFFPIGLIDHTPSIDHVTEDGTLSTPDGNNGTLSTPDGNN